MEDVTVEEPILDIDVSDAKNSLEERLMLTVAEVEGRPANPQAMQLV